MQRIQPWFRHRGRNNLRKHKQTKPLVTDGANKSARAGRCRKHRGMTPKADRVKIVLDQSEAFWKTKSLAEMSRPEWDSLCDGCARCCLYKASRESDNAATWTNIACHLLDLKTCKCTNYVGRTDGCNTLTPENWMDIAWVLPPSCAFRLVAEGKDLAWWHPLVSGDPESVHRAGISVRGKCVPPKQAGPTWLHVVDWPARVPRGLRALANRPSGSVYPGIEPRTDDHAGAGDAPQASSTQARAGTLSRRTSFAMEPSPHGAPDHRCVVGAYQLVHGEGAGDGGGAGVPSHSNGHRVEPRHDYGNASLGVNRGGRLGVGPRNEVTTNPGAYATR